MILKYFIINFLAITCVNDNFIYPIRHNIILNINLPCFFFCLFICVWLSECILVQVHVCRGFEFMWWGHTCGDQRLTLDAIPQELSTYLIGLEHTN